MKKGYILTFITIVFVICALSITGVYFWLSNEKTSIKTEPVNYPASLSTPTASVSTLIDISAPIDINKITWRKIESKRVSLSFNYPSVWPIAFQPDEDIRRNQDFYNKIVSSDPGQSYPLESIAFTSVWIGNAGEDSLGWFIVTRQKGIETIDDYVKSEDKEGKIYVKGRNVTVPRPKIIYSQVGGETAVSVIDQSGLANLSPTDSTNDFIVVKNGLIYRFFATPSFKARINAEINAKLFKDIIASVQF